MKNIFAPAFKSIKKIFRSTQCRSTETIDATRRRSPIYCSPRISFDYGRNSVSGVLPSETRRLSFDRPPARMSFQRSFGEDPQRKFICHYCRMKAKKRIDFRDFNADYVFRTRQQLEEHLNEHLRKTDMFIKECNLKNHKGDSCNCVFPNYAMFVQHIMESHRNDPIPWPTESDKEAFDGDYVPKKYCAFQYADGSWCRAKRFLNYAELVEHYKSKHPNQEIPKPTETDLFEYHDKEKEEEE